MSFNIKPTKLSTTEQADLKGEQNLPSNSTSLDTLPYRAEKDLEIGYTYTSGTSAPPVSSSRFYLPVLYLNDKKQWSQKETKTPFTNKVSEEVCLSKCCGVDGLKSACCILDLEHTEHVLGPVDEHWVAEMIKKSRSIHQKMTREDLVIDQEEGEIVGATFFNARKTSEDDVEGGSKQNVWFDKRSYPMMRYQVFGGRLSCKFLNTKNGKCTIYENRPMMCKSYYCSYVEANFLTNNVPKNKRK